MALLSGCMKLTKMQNNGYIHWPVKSGILIKRCSGYLFCISDISFSFVTSLDAFFVFRSLLGLFYEVIFSTEHASTLVRI